MRWTLIRTDRLSDLLYEAARYRVLFEEQKAANVALQRQQARYAEEEESRRVAAVIAHLAADE